ncbi:MAG: GH2 [uncultured Nocardioides sp.]|uniref:GH2 n=1 Tax=uncultured Nocardioides sp. TaxID=198441 RepID=A0A6J4N613_9ACTN|nr:MAG: GH2 [uncultured Nocardioides sp.]
MSVKPRPSISLDGLWDLELIDVPAGVGLHTVQVDVPGSWTLQVPGAELAHGTVRYRRAFVVPEDWPSDGCLLLRFGAVNHEARVNLNGHELGQHRGGWTPFALRIDPHQLTGVEEHLEVVVSYPPLLAEDGQSLQEIPHGKQTWYGSNAGIWQSVVLEQRSLIHLASVRVRADAGTGRMSARVALSDPPPDQGRVRMVVREHAATSSGDVAVAEEPVGAVSPRGEMDLTATVADPRLWSPEGPHLYDVALELWDGDRLADATTVRTGYRTVAAKGGQVVLNGEPIEVRGVLDQDYHPGSEIGPSGAGELEALFRETKRLGFNMLRCHIKRPDPLYFELADELGILVWAEVPSWQRFTPQAAENVETLLTDMIGLDGHHPSVVAWSVVNESWGIDLRDAGQRAWLAATYERAKDLAPDSLVVDNSACDPNFHVRTDINDFHVYRGLPERRLAWDTWVDDFASRPAWTFSPYGDADSTGEEPLIVSEFGNWGLPDITDAMTPEGSDPWWAEPGAEWAFGAAHASQVVRRFEQSPLRDVFGSWGGLVEATQHQQLTALRYQIGSLRRRPELAGYVLTQLSDVQWEANGLFDMSRKPRQFVDELALVNGPSTVVLRPTRHSQLSEGIVDVTIDVVPGPGADASAGDWVVRLDVDGAHPQAFPVTPATRTALTASVLMPAGPTTASVRAELRIGGQLRARDVAEIAVLPPLEPRPRAVRVHDPVLERWLEGLDVRTASKGGLGTPLVTRVFGPSAEAYARRGGRVLVLAEDESALGSAFRAPLLARLSPREGDGDWVPRFDWLDRRGAFAELPGGPLLDLAFENVIGHLVIDFLPAPLRPARQHSAVFAGWLRHQASTSVTLPWSQGSVTITTLALRTAGTDDVAAAALARAMLEVAAS